MSRFRTFFFSDFKKIKKTTNVEALELEFVCFSTKKLKSALNQTQVLNTVKPPWTPSN